MMKTQVVLFTLLSFLRFSYGQLTLQDSLVAHYPFDGNALDISGNGNHGTVVGPILTTDRFGTPNSAYQFDGIDDYMDFLNNMKFKPQLPVTIAAWVFIDSQGEDVVFRNDYRPNTYDGVWFTIVNSSQGNRVLSAAYGDGGGIGPQSRRTKNGYTTLNLNQWYHVAAVIRGPGNADVFLNGKNDCGFYSGNGSALSYSNNDGKIGEWYPTGGTGPSNWFHGKLDDIRFYNRELSIEEIRTLAGVSNISTLAVCQGEVTQLDASDGSVGYQWSPSVGLSCTSCPNPTATVNDTTIYQVIRTNTFACPDTFFFQLNARDCNVSVCDPSFTLQDSLVAHYPFDGNANDASGNGNNGIPVGPTLTTDRFGNPNSAYQFDGVDDYMDFMNNQKFKPQLPVTIASWIYIDSPGEDIVFRNDYQPATYDGVWLTVTNSSQGNRVISAAYGDGGGIGPQSRQTKNGYSSLDIGKWHHIAAVIRGPGDMDVFLDGNNDCGFYSGNGGVLNYTNANGKIGEWYSTGGTGFPNWFHGKLDDIRFYNRELCIDEIRTLADYNNLSTVNICSGDTTNLDASDGSTSYSWSPSLGLSCTNCASPQAYPTDTTLYQVIRDNGFSCFDTLFFQLNPETCNVIPPCDTTLLEADFEYTTDGLVLTGINQSRGPDSGIDRWRWNFGDGNSRSVFQPDTITHQYFMPGTYDVCLIVEKFYDELNVCLDTFCQTVMVDSIANSYGESLEAFGWKLSPNPTSSSILLEKEETPPLPVELKIFDLSGKILLEKNFLFNTKTEIPVQYLSPGLYILQIKEEQKLGYWKFLKE
ncbi:MAG: LamG-like jellyroll fold domain-containing protein [Bacteroidota bacterium]